MPGEVCTVVLPPPDMFNLGFLKTTSINGSDDMLLPLGLCHCWGREVQATSSGIDFISFCHVIVGHKIH